MRIFGKDRRHCSSDDRPGMSRRRPSYPFTAVGELPPTAPAAIGNPDEGPSSSSRRSRRSLSPSSYHRRPAAAILFLRRRVISPEIYCNWLGFTVPPLLVASGSPLPGGKGRPRHRHWRLVGELASGGRMKTPLGGEARRRGATWRVDPGHAPAVVSR